MLSCVIKSNKLEDQSHNLKFHLTEIYQYYYYFLFEKECFENSPSLHVDWVQDHGHDFKCACTLI